MKMTKNGKLIEKLNVIFLGTTVFNTKKFANKKLHWFVDFITGYFFYCCITNSISS